MKLLQTQRELRHKKKNNIHSRKWKNPRHSSRFFFFFFFLSRYLDRLPRYKNSKASVELKTVITNDAIRWPRYFSCEMRELFSRNRVVWPKFEGNGSEQVSKMANLLKINFLFARRCIGSRIEKRFKGERFRRFQRSFARSTGNHTIFELIQRFKIFLIFNRVWSNSRVN